MQAVLYPLREFEFCCISFRLSLSSSSKAPILPLFKLSRPYGLTVFNLYIRRSLGN